ncbi:MAG TPA: sigma-70 family RNA polymerase sigma factor [Chitinophagaceae bacterium]|nr:sigma-70 family RNA polymerase sigma factor [Chitinophagaceae bacterium]
MVKNSRTDGLLVLLRQGNNHAFSELYTTFYEPLANKAYCLLKERAEAEDVVQNFFVDLWKKQLYMQVHTSLHAYMHTAIRNRCIKLVAQKKKINLLLGKYIQYTGGDIMTGELLLQEKEEKMLLLIRKLPVRRLEVLKLACLQNKKYSEVAEAMGISINSVKTHLKLAFKFFRSGT